ncbi:MAG: acyl-CoA dehydrogenase family protein [Ktedonobacteraceae bacterium]|nr:acyl-CoA dehydrogenase family protein [Ktedonobacteraceae bacterium]
MQIKGYGCAGRSTVCYGLACQELGAGDSDLRTVVSVQGSLAMFALAQFGTEEQKQRSSPGPRSGPSQLGRSIPNKSRQSYQEHAINGNLASGATRRTGTRPHQCDGHVRPFLWDMRTIPSCRRTLHDFHCMELTG